jgi:phage tail sheath protein FI
VSYAAQANPDINMGVIKYRQDLLLNSSYGSLTSPWVKIYDKFTDQSLMISPESYVGRAISFISAERELWYAPAGWNYGRIIANGAGAVYNEAQRDLLYDNQINPIRVDPKKGMAIYGQKTLQVKPSPLDRVNVRFLLIVLERALKEFLEFQVFEINTPETQRRMYLEVNGYMSDIKTRNGVYDYLVVCDASNNGNEVIDNNEMYIDVRVKPVMVAEFLTGRVTVTRTGASFTQSFS